MSPSRRRNILMDAIGKAESADARLEETAPYLRQIPDTGGRECCHALESARYWIQTLKILAEREIRRMEKGTK